MEKEEKLFLAFAEDRIDQCLERGKITWTGFLDMHQQSMIKNHCRRMKFIDLHFNGGYKESERQIAMFIPLGFEAEWEKDNPLALLRIETAKGGRVLCHRDYLGSILSLGLKREMIGDILTDDGSADIVILKEICDFLLLNYSKAGRTELKLSPIPLNEIKDISDVTTERSESVASLRLDNMISAAFQTSRTEAAEAIKRGLVFVNHLEATKPDAPVVSGDRLVLRGKGKAVFQSSGGRSRKDRIYVTFQIWN